MIPKGSQLRSSDSGFTLIELMVVVLIIAILLAIAVPTFLGARERAQNRGAQANIRTAYTVAKSFYADDGDYGDATAVNLKASEPSLDYQAAASADYDVVSVAVSADNLRFGVAVRSGTGTCWYLADSATGTALYGESDVAPCTGAEALASAAALSW